MPAFGCGDITPISTTGPIKAAMVGVGAKRCGCSKKIEDWQGPACELRGRGGPQYVALAEDPNPVATAFVESGSAIGLPKIDDNNGPEMEGTSFFNMTIKDGKRFSVAKSYLLPATSPPESNGAYLCGDASVADRESEVPWCRVLPRRR